MDLDYQSFEVLEELGKKKIEHAQVFHLRIVSITRWCYFVHMVWTKKHPDGLDITRSSDK